MQWPILTPSSSPGSQEERVRSSPTCVYHSPCSWRWQGLSLGTFICVLPVWLVNADLKRPMVWLHRREVHVFKASSWFQGWGSSNLIKRKIRWLSFYLYQATHFWDLSKKCIPMGGGGDVVASKNNLCSLAGSSKFLFPLLHVND